MGIVKYPGAVWHPSTISHPRRDATWGGVIHWTAGREAGDIATLDGPNVDVQFYVTKTGRVIQFLDLWSQAWHGLHTANHNMVGIEVEGSGEAWTTAQYTALVDLVAWVSRMCRIPTRHVDPVSTPADGTMPPPDDWHGWCGHADLAGINGNNHTDTVPTVIGWARFLADVRAEASGSQVSVHSKRGAFFVGDLNHGPTVTRIANELRAHGQSLPWIASMEFRDGVTRRIGAGRLWRNGKPSRLNRRIQAHVRAGRDVVLDGVVTITQGDD